MQINISKKRGFTLIELSIVLVIIGLIMTTALATINVQVTRSRISDTKNRQENVKTALLNFIARNNRLPCPAVPTLNIGAVGYGVEALTPGTCDAAPASGVAAARVVSGVLPWVSLGLADESASDAYYNRFTYTVSSNATNLTQNTVSGMLGNITLHTAAPIALGLNPAGNQSNVCPPNYNPCLITVTVLSHGSNGFGAYGSTGVRIPVPATVDELENADLDNALIDKNFSDAAANPYDDILMSLNSNDLIEPLATKNVIENASADINQKFETISGSIATFAALNRAGAVGSRSYQIPAVALNAFGLPANTTTDPWGNPINYTAVTSPIDNATLPGLDAYTLTSLGPDGSAGGNDDIVLTVSVSDMQAKFSTYGW